MLTAWRVRELTRGLLFWQRMVPFDGWPSLPPNFEVLVVEFRQTRVEWTVEGGEAERYDASIRNDSGLSRNYTLQLCWQEIPFS